VGLLWVRERLSRGSAIGCCLREEGAVRIRHGLLLGREEVARLALGLLSSEETCAWLLLLRLSVGGTKQACPGLLLLSNRGAKQSSRWLSWLRCGRAEQASPSLLLLRLCSSGAE
jgi:hypothetical protein